MFMKRLKYALTKPQDLYIGSDYKIVSSGLIAICIIFIQYLVSVEKPDWLQTISLVAFSIAIPFLAVRVFVTQTMDRPTLPVSAYLAKSFGAIFHIGSLCTYLGITTVLAHSSWIVATVFTASCIFILFMVAFIYKDHTKAMEREKLEIEQKTLEIEQRTLEIRQKILELERDTTI